MGDKGINAKNAAGPAFASTVINAVGARNVNRVGKEVMAFAHMKRKFGGAHAASVKTINGELQKICLPFLVSVRVWSFNREWGRNKILLHIT